MNVNLSKQVVYLLCVFCVSQSLSAAQVVHQKSDEKSVHTVVILDHESYITLLYAVRGDQVQSAVVLLQNPQLACTAQQLESLLAIVYKKDNQEAWYHVKKLLESAMAFQRKQACRLLLSKL